MKKFIAILLCGSIIISMNVFSAFALDQQISTDAATIKETEIQNTIAENIASQTEFTPEELKMLH